MLTHTAIKSEDEKNEGVLWYKRSCYYSFKYLF